MLAVLTEKMIKCDLKVKILTGIILCALLVSLQFNRYSNSEPITNIIKSQEEKTFVPIDDKDKAEPATVKMSDKWIVVTSVSPPTKDIAILSAIPGWQLLVMGDTKTPANWSFPGCIYLGIEEQKSLGYSITELIPFKSYTRKNIGYLYAIQHGAQFIYDTDDDNHPNKGIISFELQPTTSGLIYSDTSKGLMNPYAHFGQPSIWPRGFPLDKVTQENNNTYRLTNFPTPAIQQGLVNGDPDVDAIYRLIKHKQNMTSLNVSFDHTAPPITLPEGVFAPFNSQNTLFHRDAFWALLLPASVAFRVTDIWRGYWAQRLLWLIGHQLAFFPPNAVQIRNAHNYISDFKEEIQFYNQAGNFINFLMTWNCSRQTFFECINDLSSAMSESKFWNQTDANVVSAWLADLKSVGYQQPKLIIRNSESNKLLEAISLPKANHSVYFSPTPASTSHSERPLDLLTFCDGNLNVSSLTEFNKKVVSNPSYSFPNLLLVIIFNFPFYKNIKFMDTLYRDYFPNMLFCSETGEYEKMLQAVDQSIPNWRSRQITFLNVSHVKGYYAYECVIRVIEMKYQVDGYLMVGDDIMLDTWNFKTLNVNRSYYQLEQRLFFNRTYNGAPHYRFPWWTYKNGKVATNEALDEILNLSRSKNNDLTTRAMQTFVLNRQTKNMSMMISTALSDLYYIPRYQSDMVAEVLKVFLKHQVYTDIAVTSTVVAFYGFPDDDTIFSGVSLWGKDRGNVFQFFNETKHYIHPVKFSKLTADEKWKRNYCDLYINRLIKNW